MKLLERNTKFIQDISTVFRDPFTTKQQVSASETQLSKMLYCK